jgi:hypothetical protein
VGERRFHQPQVHDLRRPSTTFDGLPGPPGPTIAVIHGSCFSGDGAWALLAQTDDHDAQLTAGSR